MKKIIISVMALLVSMAAMAKDKVKEIKTEPFNSLEITSMFDVKLIKSNKCKVVVTYDEEIENNLKVYVRNGKLFLGVDYGNFFDKTMSRFSNPTLKAEVYMPEMESLEMSGVSKLYSEDEFKVSDFEAEISGASEIYNLALKGNEAEIEISGASDVKLNTNIKECRISVSGSSYAEVLGNFSDLRAQCSGASSLVMEGEAKDAKCKCSGTSSIKAGKLNAEVMDAQASGASKITVRVEEKLIVNLSGASTINYYSDKDVETVIESISRASSMKKM